MGPRKRKTNPESKEPETGTETSPTENAPPVKKIRNEEEIDFKQNVEEKIVPKEEDREMEEIDEDEEVSKKRRSGRKRMKKVFSDIRHQMEFYFSDSNIAKSSFMQEALKNSEWMNLEVFMKFNKLAGILSAAFGRVDTYDLFTALAALPSDLIEVQETDSAKEIRRKIAISTREKHEEDSCTIYVENLPTTATIDSVTKLFEKFGKVLYVSLPRYKITQVVKGFAFVEFDKPEFATNALKALVVEKSRLRPDMDPAELQSVKTFVAEQEQQIAEKSPKNPVKADSAEGDVSGSVSEVKEKKKSRGKKNKSAAKEGMNVFQLPAEVVELDFSGLQILSKAEWKKLRNTYLNLQRKNMGQAKQKIRQFSNYQQQEHQTSEKQKNESSSAAAAEVPEIKVEKVEKVDAGLAFEPKVVVHFSLADPIFDVVMLKKKIKAAVMEPVKYIDARPGASSFYVRCGSPDQAKTLSNVKILGDGKVLADDEERDYWQKANKDREEKLTGKVKVKSIRPRGKDKVIKQFQKMEEKQKQSGNHKFFEEED